MTRWMTARTEHVGDICGGSLWCFYTKWLKPGFLSPSSLPKCEDTFPVSRASQRSVRGGAGSPASSRSYNASSQAEKSHVHWEREAEARPCLEGPGFLRKEASSPQVCSPGGFALFPRHCHQTSLSKLTWAAQPSERGPCFPRGEPGGSDGLVAEK